MASHSGLMAWAPRGDESGGVTGALEEPARLTCKGGRPALELVEVRGPFGGVEDKPLSQGMRDSLAEG